MELRVDEIQEILKIFLDSEMQHIHIEVGDVTVTAKKPGATAESVSPGIGAGAPLATGASPAGTDDAQHRSAEVAGGSAEQGQGTGPVGVDPAPDRAGLFELTAPILGVFYRSPAPGEAPFVEVGSEVEESDPVCIIDVMKLFNQVTAQRRGRVVDICVEDGAEVEFGQTLMWIEPREVSQ